MKNFLTWIKFLSIQFLLTVIFFFTIDFFITKFVININPYAIDEKSFRINNDFFHHTLSPSFSGEGLWGNKIYKVCTDGNGFKSTCDNLLSKRNDFDIAFIGDSFTEGIGMEYEQSFVGIYAKSHPDLRIANLGVSSYSPTIYFSKLNWLINNGYYFEHVYVFIDISDIQDESFYSRNQNGNILHSFDVRPESFRAKLISFKSFVKKNFFLFSVGYQELSNYFLKQSRTIFHQERSAWTSNLDSTGYGLNRVKGSIEKAINEMNSLYMLLKSKNIKLSIGIYPWPEQLTEFNGSKNYENLQSKIWRSFCELRCENFIDLFPIYNELVDMHGVEQVYNKYYIGGDVHFNLDGHELIFRKLIEEEKRSK